MDHVFKWMLGLVLIVLGLILSGVSVLGRMMSDSSDPETNSVARPVLLGVALFGAGIAVLVL